MEEEKINKKNYLNRLELERKNHFSNRNYLGLHDTLINICETMDYRARDERGRFVSKKDILKKQIPLLLDSFNKSISEAYSSGKISEDEANRLFEDYTTIVNNKILLNKSFRNTLKEEGEFFEQIKEKTRHLKSVVSQKETYNLKNEDEIATLPSNFSKKNICVVASAAALTFGLTFGANANDINFRDEDCFNNSKLEEKVQLPRFFERTYLHSCPETNFRNEPSKIEKIYRGDNLINEIPFESDSENLGQKLLPLAVGTISSSKSSFFSRFSQRFSKVTENIKNNALKYASFGATIAFVGFLGLEGYKKDYGSGYPIVKVVNPDSGPTNSSGLTNTSQTKGDAETNKLTERYTLIKKARNNDLAKAQIPDTLIEVLKKTEDIGKEQKTDLYFNQSTNTSVFIEKLMFNSFPAKSTNYFGVMGADYKPKIKGSSLDMNKTNLTEIEKVKIRKVPQIEERIDDSQANSLTRFVNVKFYDHFGPNVKGGERLNLMGRYAVIPDQLDLNKAGVALEKTVRKTKIKMSRKDANKKGAELLNNL